MGIFTPHNDGKQTPIKLTGEGFTAIMVWPSTKEIIKRLAGDRDVAICKLVDVAVREYESNHTRPDLRHVAADSDRIGERDV